MSRWEKFGLAVLLSGLFGMAGQVAHYGHAGGDDVVWSAVQFVTILAGALFFILG